MPLNTSKAVKSVIYNGANLPMAGEGECCWGKHYGYDENTVFLLSGDSISDNSANKSLLINNNASVDSVNYKYLSASIAFNGSSSYITIPYSARFDFGTTGDFTIEVWMRETAINHEYRCIVAGMTSAGNGAFMFGFHNTNALFGRNLVSWDIEIAIPAYSANDWHHYAIVRENGILSIYWDGVRFYNASYPHNVGLNGNDLLIGSQNLNSFYTGNMSDLRISNVARYSGETFILPTDKLPRLELENYVVSDDINTYPSNGLHTDGYYYVLMDGSKDFGMYCWIKEDRSQVVDATFIANAPANTELTSLGDGWYSIYPYLSTWSKLFAYTSETFNSSGETTITWISGNTIQGTECIIGICDTANSPSAMTNAIYTYLPQSMYFSQDAVKIWEYANQKGLAATGVKTGDEFKLIISDGVVTIAKNGTTVHTFTSAPPSSFRVVVLEYTTNTAHGKFKVRGGETQYLGFAVSDDSTAYPSNGTHTDGYHYTELSAMDYADMQAALEALGVEKS